MVGARWLRKPSFAPPPRVWCGRGWALRARRRPEQPDEQRPGAAVPAVLRLLPAWPFGSWVFWVLVDLAPVLAMTAFHRDAPPAAPPPRPLSVLASALAAAGLMLAVAGCSHVTPLGPGPAPVSLPPARDLGSPIVVQVMRSQPPTPAGECPAGSIALFGSEPNVLRAAAASSRPVQAGTGSTATLAPTATPPVPPAGVACYRPVGTPVTITSAAVSSV